MGEETEKQRYRTAQAVMPINNTRFSPSLETNQGMLNMNTSSAI